MLWTVIRDFFVMYVFGGNASDGHEYGGEIGFLYNFDEGASNLYGTAGIGVPFPSVSIWDDMQMQYISFGDWLSTTATIITLCLLLFAVFLAIKFLFKLVAGSFLKIGE